MADTRPQTSLIPKLIVVLLLAILGSLAVLLFKAFEKPTGHAIPPSHAATSAPASLSMANTPASGPSSAEPQRPAPPTELAGAGGHASAGQPGSSSPTAPAPASNTAVTATIATSPAGPVPVPVVTAPRVRFVAQPTGSEMRIDGTATAKTWVCLGRLIAGSFEVEPAWQRDPSLKSVQGLGPGNTPPKCEVSIPIRSLKSQVPVGSGIMDRRMQKEMRADEFPRIEYRLSEMAVQGDVPASGSPVTFQTKGRLAIAGVTNDVAFPVSMERVGPEVLVFRGSYATKMTTFGIPPPEFTIGGIGLKTGDNVTLTWTWCVARSAEAPAP